MTLSTDPSQAITAQVAQVGWCRAFLRKRKMGTQIFQENFMERDEVRKAVLMVKLGEAPKRKAEFQLTVGSQLRGKDHSCLWEERTWPGCWSLSTDKTKLMGKVG